MKDNSTLVIVGLAVAAWWLMKRPPSPPTAPASGSSNAAAVGTNSGNTSLWAGNGVPTLDATADSQGLMPSGVTIPGWQPLANRPERYLPASGYSGSQWAANQANQFADWISSIQVSGTPQITGVIDARSFGWDGFGERLPLISELGN